MATKREKDKAAAKRSSAKAWAEKQSGGFEPTAVRIPPGIEQLKLVEGKKPMVFDIMPFLAGADNPNAQEGWEHFERTYSIHKVPKPDGNTVWYCCPWECWKEKCPICLHRRGLSSKEEADALRPQVRHLFIVVENPSAKAAKNPTFKYLDTVHFNRGLGFGEQLATAINAARGGADFANLSGGLTVQVMVNSTKFGSVNRIDLVPRDYDYPESLLAKIPCPDTWLLKPDKKAIAVLLSGGGGDDSDEDGDDSRAQARRPHDEEEKDEDEDTDESDDDEDEDSDDEEDEEEDAKADDHGIKKGDLVTYKKKECEVVKVSGDGTSLTLEDEAGKKIMGVGPDEVTKITDESDDDDDDDEDEDEEDERPTSRKNSAATTKSGKSGKGSTARSSDDDDDDEEDEDDDDDEEDEDEPFEEESDDDEDEDDEPAAKKGGKKPARGRK